MVTRDVFQVELEKRNVVSTDTLSAELGTLGVVKDSNVAAKGLFVLPKTPTAITGVQAAGVVKDLLTALVALGLITDSTTAE